MTEGKCPFCDAKCSIAGRMFENSNLSLAFIDCTICGQFDVESRLFESLKKVETDSPEKINCIVENIQEQTKEHPWIWLSRSLKIEASLLARLGPRKYFEDYSSRSIVHSDKTNNILRTIAERAYRHGPRGVVKLSLADCFLLRMAGFEECKLWIKPLFDKGFVNSSPTHSTQLINPRNGADEIGKSSFSLTPEGWAEAERLFKNIRSNKAFIAMSFGYAERQPLEDAIKRACQKTGWEAFTIEDSNFVGGVTDEIISSINKSGLVIADFTENRKGVYYEAGYAEGRGLPVIYTVKEGYLDGNDAEGKRLHFDTRNYYHIVWTDAADLEAKLAHKIGAVVNR